MTPARYLPRFRKAHAALPDLAAREAWPRERIEAFQLERLNAVWRAARERSPHYRSLAERLGLPRRFASLAEYADRVPVLTKAEVRSERARLLSDAPPPGAWRRTGGSTGAPLAVYWGHAAHREMLWRKYRMEQAWGLDFFDRKAFLWGHAASFAPGVRGAVERRVQRLADRLRNRDRLNAYRLGPHDLDAYLRRLRDAGTRCLYGYSSAVTLLARRAAETGFGLPDLRLAILTAEPADDGMLAACRAGLAADAAVEYGSVECGVIATGVPDGSLRLCEDVVLLEAAPRDDGRHNLLVTVLNNPAFPLLRYAIEDLTDAPLEADATGFRRLAGVTGRANDALASRGGGRVHPLVVKHAFEGLGGVRRFQAHQAADGGVLVRIEATGGALQPPRLAEACERLSAQLGGYPVAVERVDRLPGNRAGKHRWVTSDFNPAGTEAAL